MNKFLIKAFKRFGLIDFYVYFYFKKRKNAKREIINYNVNDEQDIIILNNTELSSKSIPKLLWFFWDSAELPEFINKFIRKIESENQEYKVNIVGFHNLERYLKNLEFSDKKIPVANKSDIIRLELLYRYGGIWLDASIILNQPLDYFLQTYDKKHYDLIGFYRDISTTDRTRPIIESWFLATAPNNRFIKLWLEALSPLKTLGSHKYYEIVSEREDYLDICQKITNPKYLLVYLAQQIVLKDNHEFNFYLRKCEASAFLYQEQLNWDGVKLQEYLALEDEPNFVPPIIKLISSDRSYLHILSRKSLINFKSILGKRFF